MFNEKGSPRACVDASRGEAGQTLMELIVVVAVSVVIIGALVFATISSLRNAQFAKNQSQATKLAQEGLERIRSGRDKNDAISNISGVSVNSWNGDSSGNGSIWNYQIYNGCASGVVNTACYFKFINSNGGALTSIGSYTSFPSIGTEDIYGLFKRTIILSDDSATFGVQKTVAVIVRWVDFSGPHESRLTTILRKI